MSESYIASETVGAAPYGQESKAEMSIIGADTDVLHTRMRSLEHDGRPEYCTTANYLAVRRVLVDWISEISEAHGLANSTTQVAVGYLDRVLQHMDVHRSRYQLVAMACFAIAAKYEEAEEHVPLPATINKYAKNAYPPKMMHQMEILLLTRLSWKLTVITPAHFVGLFHTKGILFCDDSAAYKPLSAKVPRYLKKYTDFFADLTLQEYVFQQYPPSQLAAALVLAARKALVIRPLWTPHLENVLQYSEEELVPVLLHIWQHYRDSFPKESGNQDTQASAADKAQWEIHGSVTDLLPFYYSPFAESLAPVLSDVDSSINSSQSTSAGDACILPATQDTAPYRPTPMYASPAQAQSVSESSESAGQLAATPVIKTPHALQTGKTPGTAAASAQSSMSTAPCRAGFSAAPFENNNENTAFRSIGGATREVVPLVWGSSSKVIPGFSPLDGSACAPKSFSTADLAAHPLKQLMGDLSDARQV